MQHRKTLAFGTGVCYDNWGGKGGRLARTAAVASTAFTDKNSIQKRGNILCANVLRGILKKAEGVLSAPLPRVGHLFSHSDFPFQKNRHFPLLSVKRAVPVFLSDCLDAARRLE